MKQIYFILWILLGVYSAKAQNYNIILEQEISENVGDFNTQLNNEDWLGYSVESIGDLDGDGINDIAVGAIKDDDGGSNRGAVYILFLNIDGTVKSQQKISNISGGFSENLNDSDIFGSSISYLGDMNNDGLIELAVGAEYDGDGGYWRGAVWILSLNTNGTVNSSVKISDTQGGFTGLLGDEDVFSSDIELLGDLNGDGNPDIAVGARRDPDGGSDRGAVWILFLNSDFTVNSYQKISATSGNFNGNLSASDYFGGSVSNIGDLNDDGVIDLAIGAYRDDSGGYNHGAIYILFLNQDGTVSSHQKIDETQGGFSEVFTGNDVFFGRTIDACGDINGDGLSEIVVGAPGYINQTNQENGAIYILNLNANGTVDSYENITEGVNNFTGPLNSNGGFGFSVSYIGVLQQSHSFVIGEYKSSSSGPQKGSAWVLQLGDLVIDDADLATSIDHIDVVCKSRDINVGYAIYNNSSSLVLPAGNSFAFYINSTLIGTGATQNDIPAGGSETGSIILNIPNDILDGFNLILVGDDDGLGNGTIVEIDENNNSSNYNVDLFFPQIKNPLINLYKCDEDKDGFEIFNLTQNSALAMGIQVGVSISFYENQIDAEAGINQINNPDNYQNLSSVQTIFVRIEEDSFISCSAIDSFVINLSQEPAIDLGNITNCNYGLEAKTHFNLKQIESELDENVEVLGYFTSEENAINLQNEILNIEDYQTTENSEIIYLNLDSFQFECPQIAYMNLIVEECSISIPQGFSPNMDGINDNFEIKNLYTNYPDFNLTVFSRYGNIVYEGNRNVSEWDGTNKNSNKPLPTGVYFYVLNLKSSNYELIKSWVYLNR